MIQMPKLFRVWPLALDDHELAQQYEQKYLRYLQTSPSREWKNQLVLNEIDNNCYAKCIISRPSERPAKKEWNLPSHRKLFAAYQQARDYVEGMVQTTGRQDAPAHLARWVDYLRDSAQVVVVTVEDNADAFEIFETLNDRGLALSIADLLKNFLFGTCGADNLNFVRAQWSEMEGALQTLGKQERTVDFIRQLWGSMHGVIRGHDLFQDMREKVRGAESVLSLGTDLSEGAKSYAAILNSDHDLWDAYGTSARNALNAIRILRMERIRPLLLSIVKRFTVGEATKSLRFLESAAVRITIGSTAAGTVEDEFMKAAKEIYSGSIKTAQQLAAALAVVPNDHTFYAAFRTMRVSLPRLARYYLLKLDAIDDPDKDRILNPDEKNLDLEHILPDEDWSQWLSADLSEDKAKDLRRRFGNLAIVRTGKSGNTKLGAKPYIEKMPILAAQQSIRLTRTIPEKWPGPNWNEEQINARQDELAGMALRAWPLKVPRQ